MSRRGIALILVLLMTSLLFLMVVTLITMFRGEVFTSQTNLYRVSGLYLAEAGVAEAELALENDPNWPGVTNQAVPGADGSYTVEFSGAPAPNLESVNNLANAAWADSYRGASTVPPYSALLIVRASVHGLPRVLEVVVTRGTAIPPMADPVLASGNILLGGNVSISGVTSLTNSAPVPAGIHSNISGNVPDAVKWVNGGTDTATISGKVATSSTAGAAAVNMPGASITGGTASSTAPVALPNVDILGEIAFKSGNPAPVLNGSGVTQLASGDYYYDGDLDINGGDLKLQNGANLYVTGKLTVNGSITGSGSVYVGGETRFKGDAQLTSLRSDKNVAVFSKGSLYLEGFNGTDYLNALAATDPTLNTLWTESRDTIKSLQDLMNTGPPSEIVLGGVDYGNMDLIRRSLGQDTGGTYTPPGYPGPTQNDLMYKMARQLELTAPPSSSRDFLIAKFDNIDRFFEGKNRLDNFTASPFSTNQAIRDDWANQTNVFYGGYFDALIDGGFTADMGEVINQTNNISYNDIGSSYFQGMVFTNGFVHATNGVTVTGVVVARDDSSQATQVVNGVTVKPGDLFFDNDCKVTFVSDLYDGNGFLAPSTNLSVTTWMGR